MAVRIIRVEPRNPTGDKVEAHLRMEKFTWLNEASGGRGVATREEMFDWIVNRNGKAYVKDLTRDLKIYIFGATTADGRHYIRTAEGGAWTDHLIDLEAQEAAPPGAARPGSAM